MSSSNELLGLAAGLLTLVILEPTVQTCIRRSTKGIDLGAPDGIDANEWRSATGQVAPQSGRWIGWLERLLTFGAIWIQAPLLVIGWLAFKVASKWQVWTSIVQVPDSLATDKSLSYLRARRAWGSAVLTRFLVGTLANLGAGILGVMVGRLVNM